MKKKTLAFLYNIRNTYPDPNDPKTFAETDFDDKETIHSIIRHLEKCDYIVIPIEADDNAYSKLKKARSYIDLAFNYSMGLYGNDRYAQIPAILEILRIPYTGSSPFTQCLVLNKTKLKPFFSAYGIPTLPYQVFITGQETLNHHMIFPLIVKPSSQGSSAGITNSSIVKNETQLRKQLKLIIKTFKQPAFIETFLKGSEYSIPMLGNPPRILPIIEANYSLLPKKFLPLDSLDVKWIYEESGEDNHLVCPAKIDAKLENKIKQICQKAWTALGILDYCRIDIRCDKNNNPFVLDVNSPPGLIPPEVSLSSYFPLSARVAGIDYDQLLMQIISNAFKRYE